LQVDYEMQFLCGVAFGEPQVIEGELLLETLKHMIDSVNHLVLSFKPLLI
jgi:hypothetical protein